MNNIERKVRFTSDWLEANWGKFVAEGVEDSHGRVLTIADALSDLTAVEHKQLNEAFALGMCATKDAIEVIAKAMLVDLVVNDAWYDLLAIEEEQQEEFEYARAELAFENHDLKESAK